MRKTELLIPASSLEVLKIAVMFGADAVYIGGEAFGLRAKAKNFSPEEMKEGIEFAKEKFPEHHPKIVFCSSWLLDPQLSELLGENSKIIGFANKFMRFSYAPRRGRMGFEFVFPGYSQDKLEELPENTSLRRKLKAFYLNGGSTVFVPGFMTDTIICY